jgi:uncharacterized protein (DUF305 family)
MTWNVRVPYSSDHHEMAIMMATMCLDKAVHDELRTMCEQIVATQTAEQQMMQSWLSDWYNVAYSPQMTTGMMRQMEKLQSLVGGEVEIEFIKNMIRHHWKAVIEACQCIEKAYHDSLVGMRDDMVLAQTEEIRILQTWLCDWYGVCHYGPKASH